jgi:serine protease Do
MTTGRVRRGYLGIGGAARPLPRSATTETGQESCIEVIDVVDESPAGRAGIKIGDLIMAVDGKPMRRVTDLQTLLQHEVIGSPLTVVLLRDGNERKVQVTPTELG